MKYVKKMVICLVFSAFYASLAIYGMIELVKECDNWIGAVICMSMMILFGIHCFRGYFLSVGLKLSTENLKIFGKYVVTDVLLKVTIFVVLWCVSSRLKVDMLYYIDIHWYMHLTNVQKCSIMILGS